MARRVDFASLVASNLLIPVAALIFAIGFFPYKPFLPGLAEYERLEVGKPPPAVFDKLVFMVVDALRSDFVYADGSGFQFTQSLISSGEALPFTAYAASPTITMPKVKAMTTGSVPSFLDVILNFAESDTTSTLAHQDTWLAQMKAKGGKLVMYGDDTWLKLFPGMFDRSDGTSSFFVSDFTEVDNNVTRNVPPELNKSDWDVMVLHYLGLDHIGHKAGPNSPNMRPKQSEMDEIVRHIYSAIESEPSLGSTLFVMCGDHGMTEGGNHGGSAPGETSPALVFMSPYLTMLGKRLEIPAVPTNDFDYYAKIQQSDIAPTLAGLLGFPVPRNNLGVFIPDMLGLWSSGSQRALLLYRNALQMLTIVKATFSNPAFDDPSVKLNCKGSLSASDELACKWRKITNMQKSKGITSSMQPALTDFCRHAQRVMSSTASNYDVGKLQQGMAIATVSLVLASISLRSQLSTVSASGLLFAAIAILYGSMMFASSYVGEEQNFWYWSTAAWLVYLTIQNFRSSGTKISLSTLAPVACLLLHRVSRRWNQTGQKHAGAPDVVVVLREYPFLLWALVGLTNIELLTRLQARFTRFLKPSTTIVGTLSAAGLITTSLVFKVAFTAQDAPELFVWFQEHVLEQLQQTPLILAARVVFVGTLLTAGIMVYAAVQNGSSSGEQLLEGFHDLISIILVMQTRVHNIPLLHIFSIQKELLNSLRLSPLQVTVTSLLLGQSSFFALGNSNAISSIDLSNAYNGVSGYNVVAVGVLLFISNWAGPIWWSSAAIILHARGTRNVQSTRDSESTRIVSQLDKNRAWVREERADLRRSADTGTDGISPGDDRDRFFNHVAVLTVFTAAALVGVMAACTALRTHLFIWTVFSPKYLFAMAWAVAFHLGISVGLGGLLWSLRGY